MKIDVNNRIGYSPTELAQMVGVSLSLIRLEISRGSLLAKRIGKRRLMISVAEIERYVGMSIEKINSI